MRTSQTCDDPPYGSLRRSHLVGDDTVDADLFVVLWPPEQGQMPVPSGALVVLLTPGGDPVPDGSRRGH